MRPGFYQLQPAWTTNEKLMAHVLLQHFDVL